MAIDTQTPTWDAIYKAIRSEMPSREVFQGVVSNRNESKNQIWVQELSSDPIEVVGLASKHHYYVSGVRKDLLLPPAVPEIGDVVLVLRTAADTFKCVGVLQTTAKWNPGSGSGLGITASPIGAAGGDLSGTYPNPLNRQQTPYEDDNRSIATVPNDYNAKLRLRFRTLAALGITDTGTFASVIGYRAWSDSSGGQAVEVAFTDSGTVWHRHGSTTTWNAWQKTLDSGEVVNADIAAGAAIAYAKLALAGSIVNADIAAAAGILRSKLDFGAGLVNADMSTAMALAISKLAGYPTDGTKVLAGDGTWKYPPVVTAVTLAASASLTLTTSLQDIAGCSASLVAGTYLLIGVFDFFHSVNGGGVAVGHLDLAGIDQTDQAILLNSGAAGGDRASVSQVWIFTTASTITAKLRAVKTINAGTVAALTPHTTMSYVRLA